MDRVSIYSEFQRLAPERNIKILREDSRTEGIVVDLLVDDLRINCNWNYMDFTVAVTTVPDADSWTPGWAAVYFLAAFFENKDVSSVINEISKPPGQITWLIGYFDEVYALMLDSRCTVQKNAFFEFQAEAFKEWSERQVEAFKQGSSSA